MPLTATIGHRQTSVTRGCFYHLPDDEAFKTMWLNLTKPKDQFHQCVRISFFSPEENQTSRFVNWISVSKTMGAFGSPQHWRCKATDHHALQQMITWSLVFVQTCANCCSKRTWVPAQQQKVLPVIHTSTLGIRNIVVALNIATLDIVPVKLTISKIFAQLQETTI